MPNKVMTRTLQILTLLLAAAASNAQVLRGLDIVAEGGTTITVSPGDCRVNGKTVAVTTAVLDIRPPAGLRVENETYKLESKLAERWGPGTHLKGCSTTNPLPGRLVPDSVSVILPDGTTATQGADYALGAEWATLARLPNGRITTDTEVRVNYSVGQMRIDAIEVGPDGKVQLVKGEEAKASPQLPTLTTGSLHLANVYMPPNATAVDSWQIFPIGASFQEPSSDELKIRAALIPKTLQKLRNGEPLTIVTWGDSVTVGGDTSKPGLAYANLFITRLRERFPKANIKHVNAGIGATNTDGRLPSFSKEVLSFHPDLVTIEFINDMDFPEAKLRVNYDRALSQLRAIGSEVILITPHFSAPFMMGKALPRGAEIRPAVFTLRSIAAENHIGLADTSRRWAHLEQEGIPYVAYLYNGINHPDDRGHELFVRDLMSFFPRY